MEEWSYTSIYPLDHTGPVMGTLYLYLIHKNWTEYKGKPRKEAVANFRLKTELEYLAAHLRNIGICEYSECTMCHMPNSTMDEEYLLRRPKLNTEHQMLKNTIKLYWDARVKMR